MRMTTSIAVLSLALFGFSAHAIAGIFGSGENQFTIDFVTIGNPGNPADSTGKPPGTPNPAGSVSYEYQMGRYEVSRDMVIKASNLGGLGVTLRDMSLSGGNGVNRPATGVSWNEAARFVNWLNASKGFSPAYKFSTQPGDVGYMANEDIFLWDAGDPGFNAANPFRNSLAFYFLPSVDEWHKAAYYDPDTETYFRFPTGGNDPPTAVTSGMGANTTVYGQTFSQGPADIMAAGGPSPFGTIGQGGNVFEWTEVELDLLVLYGSTTRGSRGGNWYLNSNFLSSSFAGSRAGAGAHLDFNDYGFRVASLSTPAPLPEVPEPGSLAMWGSISLGALLYLWRRGQVRAEKGSGTNWLVFWPAARTQGGF
jgi:formylglycine-generating enzyme